MKTPKFTLNQTVTISKERSRHFGQVGKITGIRTDGNHTVWYTVALESGEVREFRAYYMTAGRVLSAEC